MSDSRSLRARDFLPEGLLRLLRLLLVGALGACASAPRPEPLVARQLSPSEEADAIEAAKRHPIALTYERPGDPYALPVAPPPVPPEPPPPVQAPPAPPAPRDQVIVVGEATPPAPTYSFPSPDGNYAWVDGAWTSAPGPSVYVDAWVGPTWGWGVGYGYPWAYPYVVAPPYHHWYSHPNHWHDHPVHYPAAHYPAAHYPTHYPAHRDYNAPVYRAPAARHDVHMAPPAARYQSAPRTQSHAAPARMQSHSAPARMQSPSSAPRRTVHMR